MVLAVTLLAVVTYVDAHLLDRGLISTVYYDPLARDATAQLQPPSPAHPFGTDALGRDVLARVVYGTKVSVQVGVLAVSISATIGISLGIVAGYFGGVVDDIVMRVVDVMLAFPGLILALAVAGFLGPSLRNVVVALAVQGWSRYARLARSTTLSLREREFVHASRMLGASHLRVMFAHVLPNSLAPLVVQATLNMGILVIAEAGLSFIGLGVQPPTPSWGILLSDGRSRLTTAWWLSVFPGLAIFVTVMGFNLLGDGLRDALDPQAVEETREV